MITCDVYATSSAFLGTKLPLVANYLAEFRNIVLSIPSMVDGNKWDRFISSLLKEVRVEVLEAKAATFEDAATISSRVDDGVASANWGAAQDGNTPIELGNFESGPSNWNKVKKDDFYNNP